MSPVREARNRVHAARMAGGAESVPTQANLGRPSPVGGNVIGVVSVNAIDWNVSRVRTRQRRILRSYPCRLCEGDKLHIPVRIIQRLEHEAKHIYME